MSWVIWVQLGCEAIGMITAALNCLDASAFCTWLRWTAGFAWPSKTVTCAPIAFAASLTACTLAVWYVLFCEYSNAAILQRLALLPRHRVPPPRSAL